MIQKNRLDMAVEIIQEPDEYSLAFLAREMVQCTLPHRNPGDIPIWTRTNGNLTLSVARITFDNKAQKIIGYPFGIIPRLILCWVTTEAVRTENRRLELGDSYADFLRKVGFDPNTGGGKRGDAKRVQDQMRRLFGASISLQRDISVGNLERETRANMLVASKSDLWWDPKAPDQIGMFGSWVEIGDDFFKTITAFPVPVDTRALRVLKRSPLALDLYFWAAHKAFSVSQKGQSQSVTWRALMKQFGGDYTDPRDFQKHASAAFKKIQAVYPGLRLESEYGGLKVLKTSRPAIPPTSKSYPHSYENVKVINGEKVHIGSPMETVKRSSLDGEKVLIPYMEPVVVVKQEPVVIGVAAVTNFAPPKVGEGEFAKERGWLRLGRFVANAAAKFVRIMARRREGELITKALSVTKLTERN